MISKENFCEHMEVAIKYIKFENAICDVYEEHCQYYPDFMFEPANKMLDSFIDLLASEFNGDPDEITDIICWWFFECDYGQNDAVIKFGKNKTKSLDTAEKLYDLLTGNID